MAGAEVTVIGESGSIFPFNAKLSGAQTTALSRQQRTGSAGKKGLPARTCPRLRGHC